MGFEPTPSKWLVPKTSALDHSATLPIAPNYFLINELIELEMRFGKAIIFLFFVFLVEELLESFSVFYTMKCFNVIPLK